MMTDYAAFYQALELSPGASPDEVKRAYFRLLRQYSPETHPEEFKRIRQAYDALKDGTPEIEEPPFPVPTNSFLQTALDMCAGHIRAGDYEAAASALESLLAIKPDEPYVLLSLANAQRLAGHPQKAAKTALRLAELYPDSRDAWRIAAMETYSRGWYKKSFPLFRKAYSLGEKRLDFLTDYAAAAADNGEYQESDRMNREILKTEKWTKDNVEYGAEAYYRLAKRTFAREDALWLLDSYAGFVPGCRRLPLDMDDLFAPLWVMFIERDACPWMTDLELNRKGDRCLALLESIRGGDKAPFLRLMRVKLTHEMVPADNRLNDADAWSALVEATFMDTDAFPFAVKDQQMKKYAMLDTRLCLLKDEETAFREDAEMVRRDYPILYEPNRDFIEEALNGDREALYDVVKRQFLKLYDKFSGSVFQKRCPEEVPALFHEVQIHSGDQPFIRSGKKVGRNDPCPCGSGKKFKRCCQGKGIYD